MTNPIRTIIISLLVCCHTSYAQSQFQGFPHPTPITDANPQIREDISINIPTRLKVNRTTDAISVSVESDSLKPQTIKIGSKMITGVEGRVLIYPKGSKRPSPDGLAGSFLGGFIGWTQNFPAKPSIDYNVEFDFEIFETNIPPQHLWSPQSGKYKVVFTGTLKQSSDRMAEQGTANP